MPRRLLPLAALALAVAVLGAGCADDVAPAARIGDTTISHDELMADVEEWAGNDQTQASQTLPIIGNRHAYAGAPVTEIISERIVLGIVGNEFDRLGLELTEADRTQAFGLIGIDPTQEEALLGGFSDEYREAYLQRWAEFAAVQTAIGDELQTVASEAAADVEVNPRYGTWDPVTFTVVPPAPPSGERGATTEP